MSKLQVDQITDAAGTGPVVMPNGITTIQVRAGQLTDQTGGGSPSFPNGLSTPNLIQGYDTTVTAGGFTTLINGSAYQQYFTGTLNHSVVLPVASTMVLGQQYRIVNAGTGTLAIVSSGADPVLSMTADTVAFLTCIATTGTDASSWDVSYSAGASTGTVTSVDISGGTTGLTAVGGPIVGAGVLTLTGTLAVSHGGTGRTTATLNGLLYGQGLGSLAVTAAGTQYQVLQAGVGGVPGFGAVDLGQSSAVTGLLPIAHGGTGGSTSTGTGALVLASGPVLTSPNLGTPSNINLSNAIGLPLATGTSGVLAIGSGGTGQSTQQGALDALVGPQQANRLLRSDGTHSTLAQVDLTTDVTGILPVAQGGTGGSTTTGTGAVVLAVSPVLTTPDLGQPSNLDLSNAVNLPLGSGVSGTLPIGSGGTGVTVLPAVPTASAFAAWDLQANLQANNLIDGYGTTVTAGSTTTLTVASAGLQHFTGTLNQTVVLPVVSTLVPGLQFQVTNRSAGQLTVQSSGGNTVLQVAAGTTATFTCIATTGTGAAAWNSYQGNPGGGMAIGTAVGGGTAGSVLFVDSSGKLGQDNATFNFNDASPAGPALGIGTVPDPSVSLHVAQAIDINHDTWVLYQSLSGHLLTLTGSSGTNGSGLSGNTLIDFSASKDLHFTSSTDTSLGGASSHLVIRGDNGNVGIGTNNPSSLFSVGATGQFQVDSNGNLVSLNNVPYSWPAAQALPGRVLSNDGTGTLSWVSTTAGVSASPVAQRLAKQNVGQVGVAGQIRAGHVLRQDSFPADVTWGGSANIYFWNLAGDFLDGGGATKYLTPVGSVPFTATGTNGSPTTCARVTGGAYLHRTSDSDFNPLAGASFSVGGWFWLSNWQVTQGLFEHGNANISDGGFLCYAQADGHIYFQGYNGSGGTADAEIKVSSDTLLPSTWHHIVLQYDFSAQSLNAYIDGQPVESKPLANIRHVTGSNDIYFGAVYDATAYFMDGAVQDLFYAPYYNLSAADIRKLASYRYDHNKNIQPQFQEWSGNVYEAAKGTCVQDTSWLVSKENANSVFWEFVDLQPTDQVDLTLADSGLSAQLVGQNNFDQTYTANPSFPVPHGLGDVFLPVILQQLPSLAWEPVAAQGYLQVTPTQLTGDLSPLFGAGAVAVRVLGALAGPAAAISSIARIDLPSAASVTYDITVGGLYTVDTTALTGDAQLNLPDVTTGRVLVVYVKDRSGAAAATGHHIQVNAYAGQTIDGVATFTISSARQSVTLVSDNVSDWSII